MAGSTFENCDLAGSAFVGTRLERTRFENCDIGFSVFTDVALGGSKIGKSCLVLVNVDGNVDNMVINGIKLRHLFAAYEKQQRGTGDTTVPSEEIAEPSPAADCLVAHYPFDGNADDASGNGHHGRVHGASLTQDRHGRENRAYYFDGSSYIEVPHHADFDLTDAITVCAWVNPTAGSEPGYVLAKGNYDTYAIHVPEHPCVWGAGDFVALLRDIHFNAPCPCGTWSHLAFTFDRKSQKVVQYVNAEKANEEDYEGPITTNKRNLQIGRRLPRAFYYTGAIDDVRIYNRALSGAEIKDIAFQEGVGS